MFEEEEPGKPKDWKCTIGVIIFVSIINLIIFVVIRVLLDSENEFDEPIIQGQLRDDLTKFLGIFALSFCFGCYCCFCCGGECFKWPKFLCGKESSLSQCWEEIMKRPNATKNLSFRRKQKKHSTILTETFENTPDVYDPTEKEEENVRQYSTRPNKLEIPARENNHHYSIDLPRLNYIDVPLQLMTPSTTSTTNPSKNLDQGKDNRGFSTEEDIFREIV